MQDAILEYQALTARTIHRGRCRLLSVHVAGDGANGDCQLYDDTIADATDLKLHLEVLSGTSYQWKTSTEKGILFNRGIHLVANATTTKTTVEFRPEE